MFLVDTNIWLELLLDQAEAESYGGQGHSPCPTTCPEFIEGSLGEVGCYSMLTLAILY